MLTHFILLIAYNIVFLDPEIQPNESKRFDIFCMNRQGVSAPVA